VTAHAVRPSDGKAALSPLGSSEVRLTEGFWRKRADINREASLEHGLAELTRAGNLAFLAAAGQRSSTPPDVPPIENELYGRSIFNVQRIFDSDVYKWLEAVGWEAARGLPPRIRQEGDRVISLVASAQLEDGYINSWVQLVEPHSRWREWRQGHELYCGGHLIQAAVAWFRSSGDTRLLSVATAFADHLFAKADQVHPSFVPRHPGIESALVELYRCTGAHKYLELAALFIDRRGRIPPESWLFTPEFHLEDVPVREASRIRGHAVMALYLLAGAVDVSMETGDRGLLDSVIRQWNDMVERKMYITGGVGSRFYEEGFGDAYELPLDRAYSETCAAVASIMLSHRLLLATGYARYGDLVERTLYNAVLPGVSLDGRSFFYVNPLEVRGKAHLSAGPGGGRRQHWFECACCPPNVMRLLASIEQYLCTRSKDGIQINQFISSAVNTVSPSGNPLALEISSDLPWGQGALDVIVTRCDGSVWDLAVRVPSWADSVTAFISGQPVAPAADRRDGFLRYRRAWKPGDRIVLQIPMAVRAVEAHPALDACRGLVALQRGPVVYCFEEADLPAGAALEALELPLPLSSVVEPFQLLEEEVGSILVEGCLHTTRSWDGVLYRSWSQPSAAHTGDAVRLRAVPYCTWANRSGIAMRVWMPSEERKP
jgi:DUF1680 family protein